MSSTAIENYRQLFNLEFVSETKQEDTNTNSQNNTGTHLSYLVQPRLHGERQRLPSLKVLWIRIFSYSGPTKKETMVFRRLCKLFSKALERPNIYWTTFPHPKYPSLRTFFHHLNTLAKDPLNKIPSVLFLANGTYEICNNGIFVTNGGSIITINIPMSIIGESREHCKIIGGLEIRGIKTEDLPSVPTPLTYLDNDVHVSNLTVCKSKYSGIYGFNGMTIHLENVSIDDCTNFGINLYQTQGNTMMNCEISNSKRSGIKTHGALLTIRGSTCIHHNCTNYVDYGLNTYDTNSFIHIVAPLSKEIISTDNQGGGDWKCTEGSAFEGGKISNITEDEKTQTRSSVLNYTYVV